MKEIYTYLNYLSLKAFDMIFSDEANATTCVSLYIRQWDSKADLYGLVRSVKLRFHSVVKVTSKKSNPYLVTTLFSKV